MQKHLIRICFKLLNMCETVAITGYKHILSLCLLNVKFYTILIFYIAFASRSCYKLIITYMSDTYIIARIFFLNRPKKTNT